MKKILPFLILFCLTTVAFAQNSALSVNTSTGAVVGPTSAATFRSGNGIAASADNKINLKIEFNGAGTLLTTGNTPLPWTAHNSYTITRWSISCDAGTATIKLWKKASGTAIPTVSDNISTNGFAIASGTHTVWSSTVSDLSTAAVADGDMIMGNLTAVSGATYVCLELELTK